MKESSFPENIPVFGECARCPTSAANLQMWFFKDGAPGTGLSAFPEYAAGLKSGRGAPDAGTILKLNDPVEVQNAKL